MSSWRTIHTHIPQCSICSTPVTDAHSHPVHLAEQVLPPALRTRLIDEGWQVRPARLTCPPCHTQEQAAAAAEHARLHRPLVKRVDLAAKIGRGWALGQRDGDDGTRTWLVLLDGEVKGMVRRYRRRDGDWSRGWEALIGAGGPTGFVRRSATEAGSHSDRSSFLWRSRDLAAWGIATGPAFTQPNPDWARRRR